MSESARKPLCAMPSVVHCCASHFGVDWKVLLCLKRLRPKIEEIALHGHRYPRPSVRSESTGKSCHCSDERGFLGNRCCHEFCNKKAKSNKIVRSTFILFFKPAEVLFSRAHISEKIGTETCRKRWAPMDYSSGTCVVYRCRQTDRPGKANSILQIARPCAKK